MYLFDSTQDFFQSSMFQGQRFYDAKHYRKWFGWIYIALYDHLGIEEYKKDPNPDVQIKIGRSTNIDRRQKELHRDQIVKGKIQKKASIVYAWSVPLEIKFESDLKTLLAAYIREDATRAQSSEIIWGVPIVTLINVIQLSIFKTCLNMNFIRTDIKFTLRPPDTIIDGDIEYRGSRKHILPHQLVLENVFSELDIRPQGTTESLKEYIFLQDKPVDDIPRYITTTDFMTDKKVYPIGTYIYAKYKPQNRSTNHLARVIGYAGSATVKNQYAIRWLVEEDDKPLKGLPFTNDTWQYTEKVFRINKTFAEENKIPLINQIPKLFYSLRL